MKRFWSALIIVFLGTAMSAQTTTSGTSKPAKKKHVAAASKPTTADEIRELKQMMQQQQAQIQQLQQQIEQRDAAVQQLQQQVQQTQQQAQEASSSSTQTAQSVDAVKSDVSDLKANASTTALNLQETQKQVKEATESPLALHYKGVTITPGGFLAAETVTRQRGLGADVNTPFNAVPFSAANAGQLSEFFGTGRQSRLSFLVEGKLANMKMTGFYEMDWLGAGVTSNNNQSNSYLNRQRQLWAQVATNNGWSFTGGQMWSLVTETRNGMENRSEALPMSIDPQYVVGFSFARQYGFRVVKNFSDKVWLGFALENPQTTFFNPPNSPNNFVLGSSGNGGGLYNGGAGAGQGACTVLPCAPPGALANYSFNKAPDMIFKAAFQPGWGHYEVVGIVSQFRDRVFPTPGSSVGAFNDDATGFGLGLNARGTIAKHFDVGLHFLGGNGMGRYGTSSLPDATVHPDGTLALLRSYQSLATFELHFTHWDWYFNAGDEYIQRRYGLNAALKEVGYGIPANDNTGCGTEPFPGSGGFLPGSPSKCAGNTRNVIEGTFGFWYHLYQGPKGKVVFGPQYEYIYRNTWTGVGGAPNAVDNIILTSFRYYLP